jgi:hypothetical protein
VMTVNRDQTVVCFIGPSLVYMRSPAFLKNR